MVTAMLQAMRGLSSTQYVLTCGKAILRIADSWVFFSTLSSRGLTTSWVSIPDMITNTMCIWYNTNLGKRKAIENKPSYYKLCA